MKVAIVSGSRADRPGLEYLYDRMKDDPRFDPKFHPLHTFSDDSKFGMVHGASNAMIDAATFLDVDRPDVVVIAGDRWEILATAMAANMMKIPIAHIAGGDITEGSQDDCFRHAISKLSHIHFTTNPEAQKRLGLMGEEFVYMVGSPAIDRIKNAKLMDAKDAFFGIGYEPSKYTVLVNYQPETLAPDITVATNSFFKLLEYWGDDEEVGFLFCRVNQDLGSAYVEEKILQFVEHRDHAKYLDPMTPELYWSLMKACDSVAGNSSSFIYEAPILNVKVNIYGDRQSGRSRNIYVNGGACDWIMNTLAESDLPKRLRKKFHVG